MERIVVALVIALSLLSAAPTNPSTPSPPAASKTEQTLLQLEHDLPEAVLRRDTATLDRLTAEDFIGFNPRGQEVTKADVLTQTNLPGIELESLRHENIRVRVFGPAAVATGVSVLKARYQGQDVSGRFRYTRVWIKRHGRWQAVAAQSTQLP